MVTIQHANPYYDDSYAVNSANLGPYGDAITYELMPYIEKQFRGIGAGWARVMYGGSTGGWEALGVAGVLSRRLQRRVGRLSRSDRLPRVHGRQHLRRQERVSTSNGDWKQTPQPGDRDYLGHLMLDTRGATTTGSWCSARTAARAEQWDIWEAVFQPGRRRRLSASRSATRHRRDRSRGRRATGATITICATSCSATGRRSARSSTGKIHLYVGTMDNCFLNNAVYLTEDFLKNATNPPADAVVDYGDRDEHCWSGHETAYWFRQLEDRIREDRAGGSRPNELEVLVGMPGPLRHRSDPG